MFIYVSACLYWLWFTLFYDSLDKLTKYYDKNMFFINDKLLMNLLCVNYHRVLFIITVSSIILHFPTPLSPTSFIHPIFVLFVTNITLFFFS